mmetsp:Transcript_39657/g.61982  ORF Transcript_39657/g.61982 Transcript_39657/m.61982 type:complete len:303 (+) Transcript_39657:734-1642(+)
MPKSLIVNQPNENVSMHDGAADARVQGLAAVVGVARRAQLLAEVVHGPALLVERERGRVLVVAVHGAGLASHGLDEHADGHARGEGVRVDDHVRGHARLGEGHVLLRPQDAQHALLPVPAAELVADDRVARVPQGQGHPGEVRLGQPPLRPQQAHVLHHRRLRVLVLDHSLLPGQVVHVAQQRVPGLDPGPDVREPVLAQRGLDLCAALLVAGGAVGEPHVASLGRAAPLRQQVVRLGLVHGRVREAAVEGRPVQDHGVLHVVPCVADHGHNGIGALRVFIHLIGAVTCCLNNWCLGGQDPI